MPAPSPIRDSYDNEPDSSKGTDPFVVNIQRTLVLDDTGARYPVSYQTTAVRMSYAHALEQPSPCDSAPLVSALLNPNEHAYLDDNHKDSDNDSSNDEDGKLHLTVVGDY